MAPARPRETNNVVLTDFSGMMKRINARAKLNTTKPKHGSVQTTNSTDKSNGVQQNQNNDSVNGREASTNGAAEAETGAPQTDWNSMSIPTLHAYRSSYQIQTPSCFTQPHAELLYNSSKTGLRAPSIVRARRQERELQARRKKRAQLNSSTNGLTKSTKRSQKDKDKSSDRASDTSKRKGKATPTIIDEDAITQSIEPITSPTIQSLSASSSDHPSASLLNAINPDTTLVGRSSPTLLATTVRKHFNAQQLNEAETIAKFTYVAKQQGYGNGGTTPQSQSATAGSSTSGVGGGSGASCISLPVRVEGSDGDGSGWIMGSMGRQVRINESSGTGAFRLRFRPS